MKFPRNSTVGATKAASKALGIADCPLNADVWAFFLYSTEIFPRPVAEFIVRAIREGVPLADFEEFRNFTSPERNYEEAEKLTIQKEYDREISLHRIAGPFESVE